MYVCVCVCVCVSECMHVCMHVCTCMNPPSCGTLVHSYPGLSARGSSSQNLSVLRPTQTDCPVETRDTEGERGRTLEQLQRVPPTSLLPTHKKGKESPM